MSEIQLNYHKTHFLTSAPDIRHMPEDSGIEIAFAGRSNAGKSTALNSLTQQKSLARTSKTPGRTQLINLFEVEENCKIVDLPGYGYAAVPEQMKIKWQQALGEYLQKRECLGGVVILMDIRHPLKDLDQQMIEWAVSSDLPLLLLLTKADKFKYGPAKNILLQTKRELEKLDLPFSIQLFSSLKKEGIDELAEVMGRWLRIDGQSTSE